MHEPQAKLCHNMCVSWYGYGVFVALVLTVLYET